MEGVVRIPFAFDPGEAGVFRGSIRRLDPVLFGVGDEIHIASSPSRMRTHGVPETAHPGAILFVEVARSAGGRVSADVKNADPGGAGAAEGGVPVVRRQIFAPQPERGDEGQRRLLLRNM